MIETIVRDYLSHALAEPIYLEVPEQAPESFVTLEKTGSGAVDLVCRATLAVQSYAPTLYEAAQLNERVKAALAHMPDTENIASAKLNSDYNFTDTVSKRYRYQAVFDFIY